MHTEFDTTRIRTASLWSWTDHFKSLGRFRPLNHQGLHPMHRIICGFLLIALFPLGGDKVSLLTHTYPHKTLRKIKVATCNHQADSSITCGLMSDLVICKFRKVWSCMTPNVLTEIRCPLTTQTQPNPDSIIEGLTTEFQVFTVWYGIEWAFWW